MNMCTSIGDWKPETSVCVWGGGGGGRGERERGGGGGGGLNPNCLIWEHPQIAHEIHQSCTLTGEHLQFLFSPVEEYDISPPNAEFLWESLKQLTNHISPKPQPRQTVKRSQLLTAKDSEEVATFYPSFHQIP